MAQVVYQPLAGQELAKADHKVQVAHFAAFLALNPTAVLTPCNITAGALHPYLSSRKGKDGGLTNRAKIAAMLTKPITFAVLRKGIQDAKLGGDTFTDVLAAIYGGFSPSAATYGTCYLTVVTPKATK